MTTAATLIARVSAEGAVSRPVAARAVVDACTAVLANPRNIPGVGWDDKILAEALRLARTGALAPLVLPST